MENPRNSNERQSGWKSYLADRLRTLGHRNWIGIVDSAYPEQTEPGVELVPTGENHMQLVETVLAAISASPHVRAIAHVDAELEYLDESRAPGAGAFRAELGRVLEGQEVLAMPHEAIIEMLDQAGRQFSVLLFKSNLTIPYTSLFLRLECGYWEEGAEKALRQAMNEGLINPVEEEK